jgi:hypothetical protein
MKRILSRLLAPAALAAAVCWNNGASAGVYGGGLAGPGLDQHSTLTINPDGSCLFTTTEVQSRATMEQQIRMMERFQNIQEAGDEGEGATNSPSAGVSTNEVKSFTDDQLVKKITEQQEEEQSDDADQKLNVAVNTNTVTITATRSFLSLEEMFGESRFIWREGGVEFENARLEMDTNGLLRLTLTPQAGMGRYLKEARAEWKLSGLKTELKLVFPGRVVSSGFPAMQTNATWLAVDAQQDGSLDTVAKLYGAPTVITAEAGGLKLDQPLEAKKLWRSRGASGGGDNLPVTDAGPGFVAEAQSITTTTLHVFPGGEEYFEQSQAATGAVVTVKLFAPKGRTMKSISDPRVISAVDNQGRSLAAEANDDEESDFEGQRFGPGGQEDATSMQFDLRLQLPQPDAQSIDKISAEAEAVTVGEWKEMTLTNLQPNATNTLDLADVLPGAKIVIEKMSSKNHQFKLEAKLTGPPEVQRLDVRAVMPGNDQFNSNSSDRQSRVKSRQATRTVSITAYGFGDDSSVSLQSLALKVRCPQDLRRERVKFDLKGLDLF